MDKKRLIHLNDLKSICTPGSVILTKVIEERMAILEKKSNKITVLSPNNYNLKEKAKKIIKSLESAKDDFTITGYLLKDGKMIVRDVNSFNDLDLSKMEQEKRLTLLEKVDSIYLQKAEIIKINTFDTVLTGKYDVILNNNVKEESNSFYYDSDINSRNVIISDYYLGNKIMGEREVL